MLRNEEEKREKNPNKNKQTNKQITRTRKNKTDNNFLFDSL